MPKFVGINTPRTAKQNLSRQELKQRRSKIEQRTIQRRATQSAISSMEMRAWIAKLFRNL